MAVILVPERRTLKARLFIAIIYLVLSLGGITMVWPFLVMVASSLTGPYDYYRFSPLVRAVWSREDRYLRVMSGYFQRFPKDVYPEAPLHWGSWLIVARDRAAAREFASQELAAMSDPARAQQWRQAAFDYSEFNKSYDIRNSVCNFDQRDVAGFVRRYYEQRLEESDPAGYSQMSGRQRQEGALALLNSEWLIRYPTFFGIRMVAQQRAPLHHAGWDYQSGDLKSEVYQDFKQSYRERSQSPLSRTTPYLSRPLWLAYLKRPDVMERLGLDKGAPFTVEAYSQAGGGRELSSLEYLPFPLVGETTPAMHNEWSRFIRQAYPRRLLRVRVTPELERQYQRYVEGVCRTPEAYTKLTGEGIGSFEDVRLLPYENSTLWRNFIPQVEIGALEILSAEGAWQEFLLQRYGSLAAVNQAYGWDLGQVESARLPLREAYAVTFAERGWQELFNGMAANYRLVGEYLFVRGQAFGNTVLLVVLSILSALTINPLAAYALSRSGMRAAEKVMLFLLATMAFPAAVTAIPGFLLIRDLGLLNTFAALVMPTMASGLSIFILKGFFDGLPRELYEAAEIDGAREWQIFLRITLPMTTPILAVSALNAFVHAYNSWEWALLVCQHQSRWTLAVWMYQMSQQLVDQPWAVMAGFVLVSLPTAAVFIACQRVILRGIVLPSMK